MTYSSRTWTWHFFRKEKKMQECHQKGPKGPKKSWVEVVWDLGYGKQGCCAPAWGYFEAYQLFLSPRWRITIRGGRKLYFLESNEKEVERSKQTCLWFQTYLKHFNSGSQDSRDLCRMNWNVPEIFLIFSINIHSYKPILVKKTWNKPAKKITYIFVEKKCRKLINVALWCFGFISLIKKENVNIVIRFQTCHTSFSCLHESTFPVRCTLFCRSFYGGYYTQIMDKGFQSTQYIHDIIIYNTTWFENVQN